VKLLTAALALSVIASTPASADVVFDSGAFNGTIDAYTLGYGYVVSNSFTIVAPIVVEGFTFVSWNEQGSVTTGVQWAIGSTAFGSGLGSGTAAVTNTFLSNNNSGYDVNSNEAGGLNIALGAGTYWLSLLEATNTNNSIAYWDVNQSGLSQAVHNSIGDISAETFQILGSTAAVPEPSTWMMCGLALLGAARLRRRKA
jgi:opacity protein-like surface antigen